jgi:hypothetical protein
MDYLQKKRKNSDTSKQSEHKKKNTNKNIKEKQLNEENININKNINFSQFYNSSNEKILYFSKDVPPPKYFESSFENYSFYCSYNSFKNIREYNEDKILISCERNSVNNNNFHLFSIFDGHNGDKCCNFLQNNFDKFLFSNKNILSKPSKAIKETYIQCENKFFDLYKPKNLLLSIEKSGSCALCLLSVGKKIYSANAGDSRTVYSERGSKEVYQISFEHKPQNELIRIKKAGCKIYSPLGGNVWRLFPGAIAVM